MDLKRITKIRGCV